VWGVSARVASEVDGRRRVIKGARGRKARLAELLYRPQKGIVPRPWAAKGREAHSSAVTEQGTLQLAKRPQKNCGRVERERKDSQKKGSEALCMSENVLEGRDDQGEGKKPIGPL